MILGRSKRGGLLLTSNIPTYPFPRNLQLLEPARASRAGAGDEVLLE
jgi:hypothetical protein